VDTVGRLTGIAVMVLALLREGDMHPYEMKRLMSIRHDDRLATITNGTLYHTVARLERWGLLAEVGVDRDGNRPERTTYTLTDAGRDAVTEWVQRELPRIDRPAEFRIALAEAHNLDREVVVRLLQERHTAMAGAHAAGRAGHAGALAKGVPEQYLVEVERETVLLDAELQWLGALIDRLGRHDFPWGPESSPSLRYLEQRKAART
jgi:DNA-binding PadR family transcriptional regulator